MLPGVVGKTDMRGKLTRICSFPNEINPMCNRWCSVKCCSMYFYFNVSKMHQEGKKRFLMLVQERRKKKKKEITLGTGMNCGILLHPMP